MPADMTASFPGRSLNTSSPSTLALYLKLPPTEQSGSLWPQTGELLATRANVRKKNLKTENETQPSSRSINLTNKQVRRAKVQSAHIGGTVNSFWHRTKELVIRPQRAENLDQEALGSANTQKKAARQRLARDARRLDEDAGPWKTGRQKNEKNNRNKTDHTRRGTRCGQRKQQRPSGQRGEQPNVNISSTLSVLERLNCRRVTRTDRLTSRANAHHGQIIPAAQAHQPHVTLNTCGDWKLLVH